MKTNYDARVKFFLKKLATMNNTNVPVLTHTNKAIRLVLSEMSTEKGMSRHDGRDYFVHPIAIAQRLLDFGYSKLYNGVNLTKEESKANYETDVLIATALLHDTLEDVDWVNKDYLIREYDEYLFQQVDNVTKRDNEPIEEYLKRVSSSRISAIVKIADRLDNVCTLSESSSSHRKRQLDETRNYYLPLTKEYRTLYYEDTSFFWQARTIINSILSEVERAIEAELKLESLLSDKAKFEPS